MSPPEEREAVPELGIEPALGFEAIVSRERPPIAKRPQPLDTARCRTEPGLAPNLVELSVNTELSTRCKAKLPLPRRPKTH